jgi:aspartate/methionine/tyrosine aminotransferase
MHGIAAKLQPAERMARLGTESAFEVLARAEALRRQGKDIINLGIGQPDFKTPPHIVEAAAKALRDGHHGYTPAAGIPQCREAVAAYIKRQHGVDVSPDRVLVMPGGKVTMFFAILMFGEPGAEIMYPNPGFPIYESVIKFSGAKPVPIALLEKTGFAFDADEVLAQITPRTRLMILNSPANPTGGVVPKSEIDKLVKGLERHPHVAIMSDEIYHRLLFDGREHATLFRYPEIADRLIVLDGWSKTYAMTGWRLGWSVWPKSLVGDAERRRIIVDGLNGIPGVSCVEPGGAFYAFPNIVRKNKDARTLQDLFLTEAGVATIAGTAFGAHGEGYLRFSYANSAENIREALARIRKTLA